MNRFKKYLTCEIKDGKQVINPDAFKLANEAFELFKTLYNTHYGEIEEVDNLIAIHTGGWSENEELIREFKETGWWIRFHKITTAGGHYYFDTDFYSEKKWEVVKKGEKE